MTKNSFVTDGFTHKEVKYRAMTPATLAILEAVESPFYIGEGSEIKGLLDYLLAHKLPITEAREIVQNGEWDNAAYEYGDTLTVDDMETIGALIAEQGELLAENHAEPKGTSGKK